MPRMTSMVLGAGLALTLVASIACGSKKAEETPKTASTTVAATATTKAAAATAAATAAAKTGGGAGVAVGAALSPAQFKEAMCGSVKPLVGKSGAPATGAPTGMPQMPANMPTEAMLKQMVDNAPPELKADFAVFAKYQGEFLNAYNAAMTRAGGDMMKLAMEMANDPALMKAMEGGGADVAKASANIDAWITKNC